MILQNDDISESEICSDSLTLLGFSILEGDFSFLYPKINIYSNQNRFDFTRDRHNPIHFFFTFKLKISGISYHNINW